MYNLPRLINLEEPNKIITYPKFHKLQYLIYAYTDMFKNYYFTSGLRVDNSNLLVKLVKKIVDIIITYKTKKDIIEFISYYKPYLAKEFKITNFLKGYKKGVTDTILTDITEFFLCLDLKNGLSIEAFESYDYLDIHSIRVLSHPYTDYLLYHPLNYINSYDPINYMVYGIDLELLTIQVYNWYLENKGKDLNYSKFVAEVLLTNLVEDFIDLTLLNRLYTYFRDKNFDGILDFLNTNPFYVPEFNKDINDYIKWIKKEITQHRNFSITDKLNIVKPFIKENIRHVIKINIKNVNVNNAWLILLSRLDYFLFVTEHLYNNREDRDKIIDLKNFIKSIKTNKLLEDLDLIVKSSVEEKIDKILKRS